MCVWGGGVRTRAGGAAVLHVLLELARSDRIFPKLAAGNWGTPIAQGACGDHLGHKRVFLALHAVCAFNVCVCRSPWWFS